MPCNSSYLEPTARERESVRLMELLNEVGIINEKPGCYGQVDMLDEHTELLCDWCQKNEVKDQSLELQIWWRDHQKADKARLEKEIKQHKEDEQKQRALSKLTDYEKKLLGL